MTKINARVTNNYYRCNKCYKKLMQIRKASNIDITKLQIIIANVGATNKQTKHNKEKEKKYTDTICGRCLIFKIIVNPDSM